MTGSSHHRLLGARTRWVTNRVRGDVADQKPRIRLPSIVAIVSAGVGVGMGRTIPWKGPFTTVVCWPTTPVCCLTTAVCRLTLGVCTLTLGVCECTSRVCRRTNGKCGLTWAVWNVAFGHCGLANIDCGPAFPGLRGASRRSWACLPGGTRPKRRGDRQLATPRTGGVLHRRSTKRAEC